MNDVERELKLVPEDPGLLDRLAAQAEFGELRVVGRRHELQRNSFFDTTSHSLGAARIGFRRRVVGDQSLATWSLKSSAEVLRGVATRSEIELQLRRDELCCANLFNGRRDRGLTQAQIGAWRPAPCRAVGAEDVGDFEGRVAHVRPTRAA